MDSNRKKIEDLLQYAENNLHKDQERSLIYANRVVILSSLAHDRDAELRAHKVAGVIKLKNGDLMEALDHNMKGIELAKEMENNQLLATFYNNSSIIFLKQNKISRAKIYLERAYEILDKLDDKIKLSSCLANLGKLFFFRGDYDRAEECYHKALAGFTKFDKSYHIAQLYLFLGELYFNIKDFTKSKNHYLLSYELSEQFNYDELLKQTIENLIDLTESTSDIESGYFYSRKLNELYSRRMDKLMVSLKSITKGVDDPISAMVVTINHELRQPLQVATIKTQILKESAEDILGSDNFRIIDEIEEALEEINKLLSKYIESDSFKVKNYTDSVKMLDFK